MPSASRSTESPVGAFARRLVSPDWLPGLLTGVSLLAVTLFTLQRHVNGSSAEYMLDVGEMQVALNLWGTLHTTGYPLYVLLGAPLVGLLKLLGVNPATAASTVSLLWSLLALGFLYDLLRARTGRPWLAGALLLVLGLAESVWIHGVVAEVYSLYLLFAVLVVRHVLRDDDAPWTRRRWLTLAALLGFGIAHHRGLAYLVPALAVYLWPHLWRERRMMPRTLALGTLLFVAGFLPYVYVPLYARLGGIWNYGDPGTLDGFLSLFFGQEAGWLWYLPRDLPTFGLNAAYVSWVVSRQLTWLGLVAGLAALVGLFFAPGYPRRSASFLALSTATYLGFTFVFPRVVLAEALLLPAYVLMVVALADALSALAWGRARLRAASAGALLAMALTLGWRNAPLVLGLTRDPTGVEFAAHVATLETGDGPTVLTVPWGPRFTALAYGLYVTHDYGGFEAVDHRGAFDLILDRDRRLVTTPETFYTFPPGWWSDYLERDIFLRSAGPGFVEIDDAPLPEADVPSGEPVQLGNGVTLVASAVEQDGPGRYRLSLYWQAVGPPGENYSVFVHLLDGDGGALIAQADSFAPVSGWYPVAEWQPGEVVRDEYLVAAPDGYDGPLALRVGMYRQLDDGSFENFEAFSQPLR